jgi:hypothetical protein
MAQRRKARIKACPELIGSEFPAPILIPLRKPPRPKLSEFFPGQFAICILIALSKKCASQD